MRGRRARRTRSASLASFANRASIGSRARPHANLYQLFVERALQLIRRGGRIGLVLPSGLISDAGAAPLRRHLFDRAEIDAITGLDNREAIFPIHRSTRFVLLTCTPGQPTQAIRCRFGITRMTIWNRGETTAARTITLTRAFVEHLSGADDLGIPELSTPRDLDDCRTHQRLHAAARHETGWCVQFSRELNASDDRRCVCDVHRSLRRAADRRGQADRPVSRLARPVPAPAGSASHDAPRASAAGAARVSRRGQRHQPAHTHRGHHPVTGRHDTHALLPEDATPDGRTAHPVRAAQQLRCELPHSTASEHPRHRHADVASAGTGDSRGTMRSSSGSARCPHHSHEKRRRSRRWRNTRSCRPSARMPIS